MSEILRERARIAAHKSHGKADDAPEVVQARQNLAALQLERAVQKTLSGWPPPTDEQLQRIAAILRSGSPSGLKAEAASGGRMAPRSQSRTKVVETRLAELDGGAA